MIYSTTSWQPKIAGLATASNSAETSAPTRYIVQRFKPPADDGYNGGQGEMRYEATEHPIPGEPIFHGPFRKMTDYGDGKYSTPTEYFVPVDPKRITSEIYNGPGGNGIEVF